MTSSARFGDLLGGHADRDDRPRGDDRLARRRPGSPARSAATRRSASLSPVVSSLLHDGRLPDHPPAVAVALGEPHRARVRPGRAARQRPVQLDRRWRRCRRSPWACPARSAPAATLGQVAGELLQLRDHVGRGDLAAVGARRIRPCAGRRCASRPGRRSGCRPGPSLAQPAGHAAGEQRSAASRGGDAPTAARRPVAAHEVLPPGGTVTRTNLRNGNRSTARPVDPDRVRCIKFGAGSAGIRTTRARCCRPQALGCERHVEPTVSWVRGAPGHGCRRRGSDRFDPTPSWTSVAGPGLALTGRLGDGRRGRARRAAAQRRAPGGAGGRAGRRGPHHRRRWSAGSGGSRRTRSWSASPPEEMYAAALAHRELAAVRLPGRAEAGHHAPRTASSRTPCCRSSPTTCRSWSTRSPPCSPPTSCRCTCWCTR